MSNKGDGIVLFSNQILNRDVTPKNGEYIIWAEQIYFSPNLSTTRVIPNLGDTKNTLIAVDLDWLDSSHSGNGSQSNFWFAINLESTNVNFDSLTVPVEKPHSAYIGKGTLLNSGYLRCVLSFTDSNGKNCAFLSTNDITIQARIKPTPKRLFLQQRKASSMMKKGEKLVSKTLSWIQ